VSDLRPIWKPRFVVATAILLVATAGLHSAISAMKIVVMKKPISLRKPLNTLPVTLGPRLDGDHRRYERVEIEPRLNPDAEEELGTKEYISWLYRDHTIEENLPGSLIRVHVPYYTGTIDAVPHVPDRCFIAHGATQLSKAVRPMTLAGDHLVTSDDGTVSSVAGGWREVTLPSGVVPVSMLEFGQRSALGDRQFAVGYFFVANGKFIGTPEGVRAHAFRSNFTDEYAYYCKVEVMLGQPGRGKRGDLVLVPTVESSEQAERLTGEFLSHLLPELIACLPDWDAVRAGTYRADVEDGSLETNTATSE
jgi:hypothetical protein